MRSAQSVWVWESEWWQQNVDSVRRLGMNLTSTVRFLFSHVHLSVDYSSCKNTLSWQTITWIMSHERISWQTTFDALWQIPTCCLFTHSLNTFPGPSCTPHICSPGTVCWRDCWCVVSPDVGCDNASADVSVFTHVNNYLTPLKTVDLERGEICIVTVFFFCCCFVF